MTQSGTHHDALQRREHRYRLLVEGVQDYAIFLLDPGGIILTWNAGAHRLKGYKADEVIGKHFSVFYPEDALRANYPAYELEVAKKEGRFEDEGWRLRKDGSRFWANVIITALLEEDGTFLGFSKITRDLTQRRAQEESLRQSEERFRLLVEGVTDYAIFMLDANGHVMTWNPGAQRISGYAAEEVIGKHFSVFYPQEVRDSGWPQHELAVATESGRFDDEGERIRRDGSTYHAKVTITALRDSQGRLVGFAKLTRDLTERRRAEALESEKRTHDELLDAERSARIEAQRATRMKDEFLATLSHELRTPLSAILGWTQVLKRSFEKVSAEDLKRAIDVIDRNARSQVQLIEDLLDLSRIMAGKVRLDLQQVSLQDVVTVAVESCEPTALAKGVALRMVLDPLPAKVSADSGRLQQVIWNLLSNAVKFTPRGGQVQVLLQRVNSHIELSVSDTGIGIPAHFLPSVFERFSQRDSSASRNFGGLGLGLAICKQLVELHGGTIRASSAGEGKGASFIVSLPLSILHTDYQEERVNPTRTLFAESDELSVPRLDGLHIFVVDDERDARELTQRILESQGARVTSFPDAETARAALVQTTPTLIISDIGMPGLDGYQFIRAVRASQGAGARIPALALTAFARPEDRKRSLIAGYQAHLSKPFDVAEFVLVVHDLVKR